MRRKDRCWDYVEDAVVEENGERKKKARCKYCLETFAPGNIRRIKHHLAGTPGRGIKPCPSAPADVRQQAEKGNEPSNTRDKTAASSSAASDILSKGFHQYSVSETKAEEKGKSVVPVPLDKKYSYEVTKNKLARWLFFNNNDFGVVETGLFLDFMKSFAHCGVDSMLANPSDLGMEFLPEMNKYVDDVMKSWEATGCTVMLDKWSNFIIVMAYSAKGAIFLNISEFSDFLDNGLFCKIVEYIGVDRVVQVVSNDVQVFSLVEDILKSKYPGIYLTRCVAHEIHSFLKAIYDEIGWVHTTIDEALSIVHHMHADIRILSLVKQYTSNNGLSRCCLHKFASSYKMLRSVLDNKDALQKLVASKDWSLLDTNKNEEAMKVIGIIQNAPFWSEAQEVMDVMEPFILVLCLVEGDGSTSGYLYEAMERASEVIEAKCSDDQTKYGKILELFEKWRSNHIIIHQIHAAAAFLNPDYMWRKVFKWSKELNQGMNFVFKTLVTDEEKKEFTEETMQYQNKTPEAFNELAIEFMKSCHPCEWWNCSGSSFPTLRKHATRILGQTCKSTSYLNPSVFALIAQRKKMNLATSETWCNLLYIIVNTMLMEKFTTIAEQNRRRIDLQNCNKMLEHFDPGQDTEDGTSNIDAKDEINSCCPNDEIMSDEAIIGKLIPFLESLKCHTVEGTNMHQFLRSMIACVQQRSQLEDGRTEQMSTQSWQGHTTGHEIAPMGSREEKAKGPCCSAGPCRMENHPSYGPIGCIPGADQAFFEPWISDLSPSILPRNTNEGDNCYFTF